MASFPYRIVCASLLALCLSVHSRQEVYAFHGVSNTQWADFDWKHITTICLFGLRDNGVWSFREEMVVNTSIIAHAHSLGIKVSMLVGIDQKQLLNTTYQKDWVAQQASIARRFSIDAVNIDYENTMSKSDSASRHALTSMHCAMRDAMKAVAGSRAQLSTDVPCGGDGYWDRNYDYAALAACTDFFVVMDYDMITSTVLANSPIDRVINGMKAYMHDFSIPPSHLVMALPWYGYHFHCAVGEPTSPLKPCLRTIRVGQIGFGAAMSIAQSSAAMIVTDLQLSSAFFTAPDANTTGLHDQIWFDNPATLRQKTAAAKSLQLRGTGMWTADSIDYSHPDVAAQMWAALVYP